MGINGGGPRDTVFGRIAARGQARRARAGGGSTNGEARGRSRRGMADFMAIG